MEIVIICLVVVIAVREYQMNQLINKLMSRNYHEYQMSNHAKDIYAPSKKEQEISLKDYERIELDLESQQELNTLNGIA